MSGGVSIQALARCALVAAAAAWVTVRLQPGPCLLAWAAVYALLEAWLATASPRWRGEARAHAVIIGQFLVVGLAVFAPAPIGIGAAGQHAGLPPPVILQSPFFLLLVCLVATHVSAERPWRTAAAGAGLIVVWIGGLSAGLARSWVLTRGRIHLPSHATGLDILRIVHAPNYLNLDLWKFDFAVAATITLVLGLAAFRLGQLAEAGAERQARRAVLGAHFAPSLLDAALSASALRPALRQVVILDCDLVGFTALAEARPAAEVAEILRAFRAAFEAAIFAHGGAIVSYAGDGAVALFGVEASAGVEADAARAAMALNARWDEVRAAFNGPPAATGVDMGEAVVGLVGAGRGAALVVLGDPLTGAARLQRLCRQARTHLLVSAAVAAVARDSVALRPIEAEGVPAFAAAPSAV